MPSKSVLGGGFAPAKIRLAATRIALGAGLSALAVWLVSPLASAAAQSTSNGSWSFVSAPTLNPAIIEVPVPQPVAGAPSTVTGATSGQPQQAPGYILVAPIKNFAHGGKLMGKPGPEILEQNGNPVWELPLGQPIRIGTSSREKVAMDLHVATYEHQPVLVWWEGYITPNGFGNGTWEIVNQRYQAVAQVNAPPGFELDFHDIQLTTRGTAWIMADRTVPLDLTCCGGPANGSVYDQVLFEVSVKTGKVVWGWDPLQHVPLRQSYNPAPSSGTWDAYHFNSISFGPSGAPIVSARNTWAAYWIDRRTSTVFATLGGKASSFRFLGGAHFAWQHDVEQQTSNQLSLFDDEAVPAVGKQSRALLLALDWKHHTASVAHEYVLPKAALAGSQGDVEPLPNSNIFAGWGQLPYFSEYSANGTLLYLGNLPGPDETYRAFRASWVGIPSEPPAIAVRPATGASDIYASWNGDTQVAAWQLLAGSRSTSLAATGGHVPREGFETMLATASAGPYYAVQALDPTGHVLATSGAARAPAPQK